MPQTSYQDALVRRLEAAPVVAPPAPWCKLRVHPVGGLVAVGYGPQTDYLLVVSSAGRGVFDALTGERVARDSNDAGDWHTDVHLTGIGIGPLAEQAIRLAGLFGGGLPRFTDDQWGLEIVTAPWPTRHVFLVEPRQNLYGATLGGVKVDTIDLCEFRAAGFSDTGQSFAVASSCDLTLYSRAAGAGDRLANRTTT